MVPITSVHYRAQNYRRLMLGCQKGKNGRETTEKRQRIKDWLNKENISFLWLGRVSKTGRILSENGRPVIFAENERFPAKSDRWLESLNNSAHGLIIICLVKRENKNYTDCTYSC